MHVCSVRRCVCVLVPLCIWHHLLADITYHNVPCMWKSSRNGREGQVLFRKALLTLTDFISNLELTSFDSLHFSKYPEVSVGCAFVQLFFVVCTVCIWRCEHAIFVWKSFMRHIYILIVPIASYQQYYDVIPCPPPSPHAFVTALSSLTEGRIVQINPILLLLLLIIQSLNLIW